MDDLPPGVPEDDFDADAEMARWVADIEAGRERIPEEWERDGSAISISLGDACDLDPALLAAHLLGPVFAQNEAADVLAPGPVLAALTEQAASDLGALTDDQVTGVIQAARRLGNWSAYLQTVSIADFTRRRAVQCEEAKARRVPVGRRPGEFPGEELSMELICTGNYADARIERDLALTARLPRTLAGMAAGVISADRADVIAAWTQSLTDADAAYADEILAAIAPTLRYDQLARKAAALELKLNPEAVKARKELAKASRQRVEVRREDSGNASIAGRELDTLDALASKAYIDALAVRVRNGGLIEGPLGAIRARVMTELLQGRNPLNLLKPRPRPRPARMPEGGPDDHYDFDDPDVPDEPDEPGPGYDGPGGAPAWSADEERSARYLDPDDDYGRRGPLRPDQSAPPPANLNLIIPIGTLLGTSTAPAIAAGLGLLDSAETRDLVAAASRHPRTRWSATITDPEGRAIAHGRARGQHPWNPPPQQPPSPGSAPPGAPPPPPDPDHAKRLSHLLAALKIIFDPIAQDMCDHRAAEDRYTPSRKLKDLVRARTQTCDAPGCNAQALHCDLDHTTAYPDGPTCQCNLGPKCRRHHRAKQAPDWHIEQPHPGTTRWTLPNGRTHTTTPTTYDTD